MSYTINVSLTANTTSHIVLSEDTHIRQMQILNDSNDKAIKFSFGEETNNDPSLWKNATVIPPNSNIFVSSFGDGEFSMWSEETRQVSILVTDDYPYIVKGKVEPGVLKIQKFDTTITNDYVLTNIGDTPLNVSLNSAKQTSANSVTLLPGKSMYRVDNIDFFAISSEFGTSYQIIFDKPVLSID